MIVEAVLFGMGLIMLVMFASIILMFIGAGIMDVITARKRKSDVFYQLSRDYNRVRRPAAK